MPSSDETPAAAVIDRGRCAPRVRAPSASPSPRRRGRTPAGRRPSAARRSRRWRRNRGSWLDLVLRAGVGSACLPTYSMCAPRAPGQGWRARAPVVQTTSAVCMRWNALSVSRPGSPGPVPTEHTLPASEEAGRGYAAAEAARFASQLERCRRDRDGGAHGIGRPRALSSEADAARRPGADAARGDTLKCQERIAKPRRRDRPHQGGAATETRAQGQEDAEEDAPATRARAAMEEGIVAGRRLR